MTVAEFLAWIDEHEEEINFDANLWIYHCQDCVGQMVETVSLENGDIILG